MTEWPGDDEGRRRLWVKAFSKNCAKLSVQNELFVLSREAPPPDTPANSPTLQPARRTPFFVVAGGKWGVKCCGRQNLYSSLGGRATPAEAAAPAPTRPGRTITLVLSDHHHHTFAGPLTEQSSLVGNM